MRDNVFGLDYGTYVDLITTNKKLELDFTTIEEEKQLTTSLFRLMTNVQ